MYILYCDSKPELTCVIEEAKEAYLVAKEIAEENVVDIVIYNAKIVGIAEHVNEVVVKKFRKPSVAKVTNKSIKKAMEEIANGNKIDVGPITIPAGKGVSVSNTEDEELPHGARCSLDGNIAVGRKKGPTGEYVYLCVDCMGAVSRNVRN